MIDRYDTDPDRFVDEAENADPALCRTHGHDWRSSSFCWRCGRPEDGR